MTKLILLLLVVTLCGASMIHAIETEDSADKSISILRQYIRFNLEEVRKFTDKIIQKLQDVVQILWEKVSEALIIVKNKIEKIVEVTVQKIDEFGDKLLAKIVLVQERGGEAANCVEGKEDQLKDIGAQSHKELIGAVEVAWEKMQIVIESLKPAGVGITRLMKEIKETAAKCLTEKNLIKSVSCLLGKIEQIRSKADSLTKLVESSIKSSKPPVQKNISELMQNSKEIVKNTKAAMDPIVKEVKECLAQIS